MRIIFAFAVLCLTTVVGCSGKKPGDPCDQFFQNSCDSPLSCIDLEDKKVCAGGCDKIWPKEGMPYDGCKEPGFVMAQVEYKRNGQSIGGAGCYCVPGPGVPPAAK